MLYFNNCYKLNDLRKIPSERVSCYEEKYGLYTTILRSIFFVCLLLSSIEVYSSEERLKFYEIDDTTKFEEIEKYALSNVLRHNIIGDGRIDTLANYSGERTGTLTIIYSPISHIVSSYYYYWSIKKDTDDEFTPKKHYKDFSSKLELYWKNVFNTLKDKYGQPTSVVVKKQFQESTVLSYDTQQQLDTINYSQLMDKHFDVIWENDKRKVTLINYANPVNAVIEYQYLNYDNYKLLRSEVETIEKNEKVMNILKYTLIVLFSLLAIWLVIRYIKKNHERKRQKKELLEQERKLLIQRQEEQKQKEIEEQENKRLMFERLTNEHNAYLLSLSEKYGTCDKMIRLVPSTEDYYGEILVYSETKHVVIAKKEYSFTDIIDCVVNDDIKEKETVEMFRAPSIATTKTNGGNMLKRAAIGGVLFGDAGAIIGGSTAKKNTIIQYGMESATHNRETTHNYTIAITVRDIQNPCLLINVGDNTLLKDEIASLFKVIISYNK